MTGTLAGMRLVAKIFVGGGRMWAVAEIAAGRKSCGEVAILGFSKLRG